MNNSKKLRLGVALSYLYNFVRIAVGLVNVPILTGMLGKSEYGLYNLAGAFFSYISILEASVSAGTLRFYCIARSTGDNAEMENVLGVCRRIYRLLSVLLTAVGAVAIVAFRSFYAGSLTPPELTEGSWMLTVMFVGLIVTMMNAVYIAGINANEEFVLLRLTAIVSQLLQPVLCFFIVRRLSYALTVVCIQLALNCFIALIRFGYAKRSLGIRVRIRQKNRNLDKAVLMFAGSILLGQIADQIFWKTDQVILAKLYNTAHVAVYSVSTSVYLHYMAFGVTVASVFFPRVSRYYHEDRGMQKISDLFIKVGRISFLICFLLLTGFIIFGREFLFLWVGESYSAAYGIALLVMVPFTVDICQNLGLTILQVTGQYSFRAKMYIVAAVLNIALTAVLAYFFAGYGAALSTGLTMLITSGFILNIYYMKKTKLDIRGYWKNIGQIFIRLLPLAIIAFIVNAMLGMQWSAVRFAAKIIIYTILYGAPAYFLVLNADEKKRADSTLLKIVNGVKYIFKR